MLLVAAVLFGALQLFNWWLGSKRAAQAPPLAAGGARTLAVIADGEIRTPADMAAIGVTLQRTGDSAKASIDAGQQAVRQLISELASKGVKEGDVRVIFSNANPAFGPPGGGQSNDYRATTGLRITTAEARRATEIQDAALAAGASGTSGITYSLRDDSGPRSRAADAALRSARAQADALARTMDVKINAIASVEQLTIPPQPGLPANGSGDDQVVTRIRLKVTYLY